MWLPNVQKKHLWSAILNRPIAIDVSTHALKLIDRAGGVDHYLLETSDRALGSETGVKLKRTLEKRLKVAEKVAKKQGAVALSPAEIARAAAAASKSAQAARRALAAVPVAAAAATQAAAAAGRMA